MSTKSWLPPFFLATALALASCGGGGSDGPPPGTGDPDPGPGSDGDGDGDGGDPTITYSIGGSVAGLTGTGLVVGNISNKGSDELTIDASGAFTFSNELADGEDYAVEIVAQPSNPDGVCTVADGSGTVAGADVDNVLIECTAQFAVVDVAPSDGDEAVSRAVEPELTFSADLDGATALPEHVELTSDAGEVTLSLSVSGNRLTLMPDNLLLPLTEYTLTVTTDVQGGGGERLLEDVTTTFKTRDGLWHNEIEIDAATGAAGHAQLAFDPEGNAVAVWTQAESTSNDLWSNDYTPGPGWGTAVPVAENDPDVYTEYPQYGFDADGNGLLVWTELDAFNDTGRIRTIHTITGAAAIEEQTGSMASPAEMAINAEGDAAAVWVQYDGADSHVWVNLYQAGSGWGTAKIIDEVDHPVDNADVAIDSDGNVLAVWQQTDGNPGTDVWARRYTVANDWNDASLEISDTPNYALRPKPAFDSDGNALVLWAQDFGLDRGIYASRFTAAGGWEAPELIKSAEIGQTVEGQQIAIAPDGSALAVWEHPVNDGGSVTISIFASRFTAVDRWDPAVVISHGDSFYPKIAIDGSGHALAVWQELDLSLPIGQGYAVWANRYTAGSGWTTAEQVGAHGAQIGTFMPNLAVDPVTGDGLTIWTRGGEVWVNTFTSTETLQ